MNKFVNRNKETERIGRALSSDKSVLIVVYGRRRCGKSTLMRRLLTEKDIYFAADLREPSLQIEALAKSIDPIVTGFSAVTYPNWESLFLNLNNFRE